MDCLLKVVWLLILIGISASCSNNYSAGGEQYNVETDTLFLDYGSTYGTVAHKRTHLNNGELEFQFFNINTNCITSIAVDSSVNEICIPEYGPDHIDMISFLRGSYNTFICGRDEAILLNDLGKRLGSLDFSGSDILNDNEIIRVNDNLFFNSTTYYYENKDVYFLLIKPNTMVGLDFGRIVAIDFAKSRLIPINVPAPENHSVSKSLAHYPSYSSMYFPYISVCNGNIVLSYGLHNSVFVYDLSQENENYDGTWNMISFNDIKENISIPFFNSYAVDAMILEEVKNSNYHYGPCKGDGDYVYQVYQKPRIDLEDVLSNYSCRVFNSDFSKILVDFELPKNLSYRSYSVVNDKLYIEFFQNDENRVALIEYSVGL